MKSLVRYCNKDDWQKINDSTLAPEELLSAMSRCLVGREEFTMQLLGKHNDLIWVATCRWVSSQLFDCMRFSLVWMKATPLLAFGPELQQPVAVTNGPSALSSLHLIRALTTKISKTDAISADSFLVSSCLYLSQHRRKSSWYFSPW